MSTYNVLYISDRLLLIYAPLIQKWNCKINLPLKCPLSGVYAHQIKTVVFFAPVVGFVVSVAEFVL